MKEYWHELINNMELYEENLLSDIGLINSINPFSKRELNLYDNLSPIKAAHQLFQPQKNNPNNLSQIEYSIYETDYVLENFRALIEKSTWSFSYSWILPSQAFPVTPEIMVIPFSNNFIRYFTKLFIFSYDTKGFTISGDEISFAHIKNQQAHEIKQLPFIMYKSKQLHEINKLSQDENRKFYLNIIKFTSILTKTIFAALTKNEPIEYIINSSFSILKIKDNPSYLSTKNKFIQRFDKLDQPIE